MQNFHLIELLAEVFGPGGLPSIDNCEYGIETKSLLLKIKVSEDLA